MRSSHFLFIFLIVLAGCRGSKYLANNLVQGSIPSDITNSKYVLLIQANRPVAKFVNKTMKKNYPAAYEVVSEKKLASDTKYNEVDKYRYLVVFRDGSGGTTYMQNTNANGTSSHTGGITEVYSDQIVIDRKENKQFPATNLMSHSHSQGMMLFCRAVKNM
ncbi:MAG TPA: hypothetical protein VNT20_05320 [Flavisolibacter sp.]|jgi:hypothetical protein|nr:hypothetical protein [Flavisolibacter sp.]